MNMKNLNVFRRLDELELDNLYLRTVLKNTRADIESLKALLRPSPKAVKSEDALDKAAERKRAYARAYYAKKRAEKAAA